MHTTATTRARFVGAHAALLVIPVAASAHSPAAYLGAISTSFAVGAVVAIAPKRTTLRRGGGAPAGWGRLAAIAVVEAILPPVVVVIGFTSGQLALLAAAAAYVAIAAALHSVAFRGRIRLAAAAGLSLVAPLVGALVMLVAGFALYEAFGG